MGYNLATNLSPQPDFIEIADYWEVECLKKADHSTSVLDIAKAMGISDDVQENEADERETELEVELQQVVDEIERRIKNCMGKYPFKLDNKNVLSINNETEVEWLYIYIYLLLATRNNMTANKFVDGIDGTLIFEKLCQETLKNYLGENSKGLNFGTSTTGSFYQKLDELVLSLKECERHAIPNNITYNPQDDKLDVVAWIPFNDDLPSKLICFGQCKTGTHWQATTEQLNIDSFLRRWFQKLPAIHPIRTFLIADVVNPNDFYVRSLNSVFFDRCRIASFSKLPNEHDWFAELQLWSIGIMDKFDLSF